ncbi:hypothetical protein NGRA_0656 [Nosema granulosis]|uniref:Uncharacterized protein n=1 Tax=Nosema granulosis TaxID=83296 RepID=A0A9P6H349_9MICR|nr:hypothetical protein NGRA_0656 [Nosema granulosis]
MNFVDANELLENRGHDKDVFAMISLTFKNMNAYEFAMEITKNVNERWFVVTAIKLIQSYLIIQTPRMNITSFKDIIKDSPPLGNLCVEREFVGVAFFIQFISAIFFDIPNKVDLMSKYPQYLYITEDFKRDMDGKRVDRCYIHIQKCVISRIKLFLSISSNLVKREDKKYWKLSSTHEFKTINKIPEEIQKTGIGVFDELVTGKNLISNILNNVESKKRNYIIDGPKTYAKIQNNQEDTQENTAVAENRSLFKKSFTKTVDKKKTVTFDLKSSKKPYTSEIDLKSFNDSFLKLIETKIDKNNIEMSLTYLIDSSFLPPYVFFGKKVCFDESDCDKTIRRCLNTSKCDKMKDGSLLFSIPINSRCLNFLLKIFELISSISEEKVLIEIKANKDLLEVCYKFDKGVYNLLKDFKQRIFPELMTVNQILHSECQEANIIDKKFIRDSNIVYDIFTSCKYKIEKKKTLISGRFSFRSKTRPTTIPGTESNYKKETIESCLFNIVEQPESFELKGINTPSENTNTRFLDILKKFLDMTKTEPFSEYLNWITNKGRKTILNSIRDYKVFYNQNILMEFIISRNICIGNDLSIKIENTKKTYITILQEYQNILQFVRKHLNDREIVDLINNVFQGNLYSDKSKEMIEIRMLVSIALYHDIPLEILMNMSIIEHRDYIEKQVSDIIGGNTDLIKQLRTTIYNYLILIRLRNELMIKMCMKKVLYIILEQMKREIMPDFS